MSVAVAIDRLAEEVQRLGPGAFLITVSPESKSHVVSVLVRVEGAELLTEAGRTSQANLGANPKATLLWSAPADEPYSLIVDGTAEVGPDDVVAVRPERAVLHRVAGVSADIPSCVKLETTD